MASVFKGIGGVFSTILGIGSAPKPKAPPLMPDPGNPALQNARAQTAAGLQARSGRQSTILSTPAMTDYSSPTLGR